MTFFFYDLETSGVNARTSRIMQFAGQRTDMDLKPIGKPINTLIKLTEDILPEPEAILVHGTTPQQTQAEGITEAEFVKLFNSEISIPDTIFVGFNTVRFDDEFMRFLFYRNFSDPYEWQWKDNRSRWDLLDVSRMTRALRPEGIKWPFAPDGKPSNRLELLTSINKLDHADAHDALSDVDATIALARLIRQKQPKLFDYLLNLRNKKTVQSFVDSNKTFLYSSGKYSGDFEKTAVVAKISDHPDKNGALVYDLRHDPSEFLDMTPEQLVKRWKYDKESKDARLPIKSLQYNRCPAVAPMSVLDDDSKKRLKINLKNIEKNLQTLAESKIFTANLLKAIGIINAARQDQIVLASSDIDVDSRLYDRFIPDEDRNLSNKLLAVEPQEISAFLDKFSDKRLKTLLPLYKARNFPKFLTDDEQAAWEDYRSRVLTAGKESSRLAQFAIKLQEVSQRKGITDKDRYLLEELQLWAENIVPEMA